MSRVPVAEGLGTRRLPSSGVVLGTRAPLSPGPYYLREGTRAPTFPPLLEELNFKFEGSQLEGTHVLFTIATAAALSDRTVGTAVPVAAVTFVEPPLAPSKLSASRLLR